MGMYDTAHRYCDGDNIQGLQNPYITICLEPRADARGTGDEEEGRTVCDLETTTTGEGRGYIHMTEA